MKTIAPASRRTRKPRALTRTKVKDLPTTGDVIDLVPLVLKLEHILVPIDFSKTSSKALHYAVPLARQFGAKVTLLHVVDYPMYPPELGYLAMSDAETTRRTAKRLKDMARRAIPAELRSDCVVRFGIGFDTIAAVAKELPADLIVLTTHGYTGLKHVVMGSTAERVVRHAPCPVLVVRERERDFA
jgi:nucleotide-binding universal stress UspA family protein